MTFSYRRIYRGPIRAALLDWAGTTMDFGCMALDGVRARWTAAQGRPPGEKDVDRMLPTSSRCSSTVCPSIPS